MAEQGRVGDRAACFQWGSQPSTGLLGRGAAQKKVGRGCSHSREVAGALKFKIERDLQTNKEL